VSFQMPFSSSQAMISSRVIGWTQTSLHEKWDTHIVVLEVSSESEDFLSPALPISARDTNFHFDRRFRMLVNLGESSPMAGMYVTGTLEGMLPQGLVQMRLNIEGDHLRHSYGTPVWDVETGSMLGIFFSVLRGSQIGFMVSTQIIATAWPDFKVGFVIPERAGAPRTKPPKIFICHANEDSAAAEEIYERLKEDDYDPWLDKRSLIAGQKWDYEIKKAVKEADFFVVLLSQNSVGKKGYIQREFKLAMETLEEVPDGQIYLIPIKIDDCLIPYQFAAFQWVNLEGTEGYDQVRKAIQFQLSSAATQGTRSKQQTV
jgi:TIR domain